MNSKTKIIFIVGLFVFIIAGAGFYIWQDYLETESPNKAEEVKEIKEIPANLETESPSDQNDNNLGIELLSKLTRNFPKGADPKIVSEIKELSQTLKDNNDYYEGWLQLGILRKNIGDLEGAAEAWQYAAVIHPDNPTAYLNLGDLYGYYFHDNQKAEENLLKAIKIEPANIYAYQKTYEFYADTNQPEKARQILEQGIAANPDTSQSLQLFLNP